jgi:hypothetical protein
MRSQRYKTRDREKLHTNFAMNVRSQCPKNLFIVDGLIKTNDYLSKGWFRVLRDQINSDYILLILVGNTTRCAVSIHLGATGRNPSVPLADSATMAIYG